MSNQRPLKREHYRTALKELPLRPHDLVLDCGTGPGEGLRGLTTALPDRVGLVGLDVAFDALRRARRRVRAVSFPSPVHFVQNQPHRLPLDKNVFAGVILAFVLHELDSPRPVLRELARTLNPRGRLAVLETRPEPPLAHSGFRHGMRPTRVRKLLSDGGWKTLSRRDLKRNHYLMLARRSPTGASGKAASDASGSP